MEALPLIKTYITIPIDLTDAIIRQTKSINLLRVYLLLNSHSHGHLRLSSGNLHWIGHKLGISYQTVQNNIKRLIAQNWIGLNKARGIYHIRGIRAVQKMVDNSSRIGATLLVETELYDVERFKGFVYGASIGNLIRQQVWWAKRKLGEGYQKGCSRKGVKSKRLNQKSNKALPTHFPVAANAISKVFGIAKSSASEYRALAQKYGYLDIRSNLKPLTTAQARFYQEDPAIRDRVRRKRGRLFLQDCHLVASLMEYRKIPAPKRSQRRNVA